LFDEDVAVGEEEDALFAAGFPEAPDDLEGGVSFSGAGGHDEEAAVVAGGDGFNGGVDGVALVVAGGFIATIGEIVRQADSGNSSKFSIRVAH